MSSGTAPSGTACIPPTPGGAKRRLMRARGPRSIALLSALNLLDLRVFEFDRSGAAEDRHRNLAPRLFLVDILDDAVERGERPVRDPHLLADLEGDRRFRPFDPFLHLMDDARRLGVADRQRLAAAA